MKFGAQMLERCWTRFVVRRALTSRAYAGRLGEARAARYLKRRAGFRVLLRNWRHGHGEIDLICLDGKTLVFVEVRTRRDSAKVSGFHSITKKKRESLQKTMRAYVNGLAERPDAVRLDVVEVVLCENGELEVRHFDNVSGVCV